MRRSERFPQRRAQKWHAFREESLLGSEPEGAPRPGHEKTGAVCAGVPLRLPVKRANMLAGGAITICSVLRADAMAVLSDLTRNPIGVWKRGNDIAHQLRLPDAPGVAADYNHAPARR